MTSAKTKAWCLVIGFFILLMGVSAATMPSAPRDPARWWNSGNHAAGCVWSYQNPPPNNYATMQVWDNQQRCLTIAWEKKKGAPDFGDSIR